MTMSWNLMLFLVHLPFVFMAIALLRKTPCWMQFALMLILVFSMGSTAAGYYFRAEGEDVLGWGFLIVGLFLGHASNLVLIWRLTWQNPAWKLSSPRSLALPQQ